MMAEIQVPTNIRNGIAIRHIGSTDARCPISSKIPTFVAYFLKPVLSEVVPTYLHDFSFQFIPILFIDSLALESSSLWEGAKGSVIQVIFPGPFLVVLKTTISSFRHEGRFVSGQKCVSHFKIQLVSQQVFPIMEGNN